MCASSTPAITSVAVVRTERGLGGELTGLGRLPIMPRFATGLCAATVVMFAMAACAGTGTNPQSTPSASGTETSFAAEVSGVTPGPGAKAVTVHVKPITGNGCAGAIRVGYHTEESGIIHANIEQDWSTASGCSASPQRQVTLTSKEPIGNRPLTLNQKAWALKNGTYETCDEQLGCNPPKDRCDSVWTRAVVSGMDVSRHSQGTVESCDGKWLIMTVPDDPTACGAEVRAGCEVNTGIKRYFLQNAPAGWALLTQTTSGGCADVLKVAPKFPRKLCSGLEPTGRFVTSAPALPSNAPPGG